MSKLLVLSVLMLSALVLERCQPDREPDLFLSSSEIRVIDGDTLARGEDRYRLKGFDTPETYRARCRAERQLGLKAKHRLAQLIQDNGGVELRVDARLDKYGRHLARAFVAGQDVGSVLISEGLARSYSGGKRAPWCP